VQTGYVFDRVLGLNVVALAIVIVFFGDLRNAAIGALAGGGLLLLPWLATRGRGLGLGDVKLAAMLGFALGVPETFTALWFTAISGGLWAAVLLVGRRAGRRSEVRFAPFLALGLGYVSVGGWL
jgi:leader peptidase (prepilin peptidase) / N-methyltransferase